MPLLLAHGECDELMPVEPMRALAAELKDHGEASYLEIAGGSHDAPLFRPEAYEWLAKQCRVLA